MDGVSQFGKDLIVNGERFIAKQTIDGNLAVKGQLCVKIGARFDKDVDIKKGRLEVKKLKIRDSCTGCT